MSCETINVVGYLSQSYMNVTPGQKHPDNNRTTDYFRATESYATEFYL